MRLSALETHIPDERIATEDIITAAGGGLAEARVFRRMFSMDHVSAAPEVETLDDQFWRITTPLAAAHDGALPDALIYVRGQPLQYATGQSPAARMAAQHPFLKSVRRQYEIDQHNCSGLFWALDLAQTLLDTSLAETVIILGGDSHLGLPVGDRYVPGCTLMGDAFCGMIVDGSSQDHQISSITLRTHPEFSPGRAGTIAEMSTFFAAHVRIVKEALNAAGFDWEGNMPLLTHNVNRLAWHDFCRTTGVAPERIRLSLLPDIGHCYICDPFLLLADELTENPAQSRDAMLVSVGMGGYVGACKVSMSAGRINSKSLRNGYSQCPQHQLS